MVWRAQWRQNVQAIECPLQGLLLIELKVHGDDRGFFVERYRADEFKRLGLPSQFAQDNHSRSAPGVLRGLHYQSNPMQGKLVGVTRGRVWDVAVDIRRRSPTFGQYYGVELTDMNGLLFYLPPGFAHGFCTLGDEPVDMLYKVTEPYNAAGEGGIRFDDPDIGIRWPIAEPKISERDKNLPSLKEYQQNAPDWPY